MERVVRVPLAYLNVVRSEPANRCEDSVANQVTALQRLVEVD
jgi:hypothetical protein